MKPPCEVSNCKKPAKFRVFRSDRIAADNLCEDHYGLIIGEVETKADRIK